jgi:hypothetical protein
MMRCPNLVWLICWKLRRAKSESPAVGRASPVQAYDFPSRTRESKWLTLASRAWQFSGGLKACWNKSAALPKSHREVVGFKRPQRASWGRFSLGPKRAARDAILTGEFSARLPLPMFRSKAYFHSRQLPACIHGASDACNERARETVGIGG